MTSEAVDSTKKMTHVLAHGLIGVGASKSVYEEKNSKVMQYLRSMPADDLHKVFNTFLVAEVIGCKGYLAAAYDQGLLTQASHTFDTLVAPNVAELTAGSHGLAGALRSLPTDCTTDGFTLVPGQEPKALAALKVECALDRNDVYGKADALKEYAMANTSAVDRLVQAIDQRKTKDVDILQRVVEADALGEGVL